MTCDEAKLQVQALADGELSESVISEVMDHVQSCYSCRADYVELLRLQKKMSGLVYEEPPKEWFEKLERRIGRKIGSGIGQILFFGSYLLLIGGDVHQNRSRGYSARCSLAPGICDFRPDPREQGRQI